MQMKMWLWMLIGFWTWEDLWKLFNNITCIDQHNFHVLVQSANWCKRDSETMNWVFIIEQWFYLYNMVCITVCASIEWVIFSGEAIHQIAEAQRAIQARLKDSVGCLVSSCLTFKHSNDENILIFNLKTND